MDLQNHTPDLLLLIATDCAHCPKVLEAATDLLKQGRIGRLEVINIAQREAPPDLAWVRSVPWLRLDELELEGAHGKAEISALLDRLSEPNIHAQYLAELLEAGKLERVLSWIERHPGYITDLISLLATTDTPMAVRIGIGAVLEEFAGNEMLEAAVSPLEEMLDAEDARVRADACYYLALTAATDVAEKIQAMTGDSDKEVREIAREALEMLEEEQD